MSDETFTRELVTLILGTAGDTYDVHTVLEEFYVMRARHAMLGEPHGLLNSLIQELERQLDVDSRNP